MSSYRVLVILILISICACVGRSSEAEDYKSAFEKQKEVMVSLKEVHQVLDESPTLRNDSLSASIHQIEESLFPIPGYALELPGHEGHNHEHNQLGLTAKEILAIQVELLQRIEDIKWILTYDK